MPPYIASPHPHPFFALSHMTSRHSPCPPLLRYTPSSSLSPSFSLLPSYLNPPHHSLPILAFQPAAFPPPRQQPTAYLVPRGWTPGSLRKAPPPLHPSLPPPPHRHASLGPVPFGTPYPGNFRCSCPDLTRVWYAGAYALTPSLLNT